MRVNKWGVGVVLAAAVMLTGCSAGASDKPADEKPEASSSQEAEASTTSDCPELKEGATIDGAVLGACMADVVQTTAGYAATTTTMGMESTSKYNPADDAIETISPVGSMILIGDDAWVKTPTSDWQAADSASTDPIISGLSKGAEAAAGIDPTAIMEALAGEFTVTGTSERLGQKVYQLTGTIEQQGMSVDAVYEITADYVALASTSAVEVNGQSVETSFTVTEWDVKQDIVAPL